MVNLLFYIVVLVIVITFIYSVWNEFRNWITVYEAKVEELQSKYSYLQSHNIKCRLKGVYSLSNWGSGRNTTARLEVHKQDFAKAKKLLEEY